MLDSHAEMHVIHYKRECSLDGLMSAHAWPTDGILCIRPIDVLHKMEHVLADFE